MGTKFGAIKRKLGLRGKTKPGEMISRMNKMKTMSMSEWEKSSMDKKLDQKLGYKEGSKKDIASDKKALKAYNLKRKLGSAMLPAEKCPDCGMKHKGSCMSYKKKGINKTKNGK